MSPLKLIYRVSRRLRTAAAEDAYREWLHAHERCGDAMRAWCATHGSSARAMAYLAYCFALDREEEAATKLQRVATGRTAA
jgi:hypothetical protein